MVGLRLVPQRTSPARITSNPLSFRLVLNLAPLPLTNFPSLETCPDHLAPVHARTPLEPGTADPNADAHGDFSVHRCLTAKKPGLFFFASGVHSDTMMVYPGHSFSAYRGDHPDRSLMHAAPRVSRSEPTLWPGPYRYKNGIQKPDFIGLTPLSVPHSQTRRLLYDQPSPPSPSSRPSIHSPCTSSLLSLSPPAHLRVHDTSRVRRNSYYVSSTS